MPSNIKVYRVGDIIRMTESGELDLDRSIDIVRKLATEAKQTTIIEKDFYASAECSRQRNQSMHELEMEILPSGSEDQGGEHQ